eukprot:COSAG02_NODE_1492_length_12334_cov_29.721945_8_plen_265_part_00
MLPWDEEHEMYECTGYEYVDADTASFCKTWLTLEDSVDEWEAGHCTCTLSVDALGNPLTYCKEWECEQLEVSKCTGAEYMVPTDPGFRMDYRYTGDGTTGAPGWSYPFPMYGGTWMQQRFPGYSNLRHPGEWDRFPYQCWRCDDEGDCWVDGPVVESEQSWCFCKDTSTTILADATTRESCIVWHCNEGGDKSGRKASEEEHYVAHDLNAVGGVMSWSGRTNSVEEFERSECRYNIIAALTRTDIPLRKIDRSAMKSRHSISVC